VNESIMIGKIISHYEILEKIGEGGMGEVYLAEDTKLKRKVALKFLPVNLTTNQESKERFKREAQAAAALNHPNIITIHEIGDLEEKTFIAMEYVEGMTLRSKIEGSQLTFDQSINIVKQICEGLGKAHQSGIVHRDIKPENIMLDNDNRVKILDFGLAKLKNVSQLTKESSTVGTIKYMSPEQTGGEPIDQRTDIWSLGVVLFEMISGQVPFKGEYEQAVIYSIINEEPPSIDETNEHVSEEADRLIRNCLKKKVEDRYPDTNKIIHDLDHLSNIQTAITSEPTHSSFNKMLFRIILFTTAILIGGYLVLNKIFTLEESDLSSSESIQWENSIAVLPFENLSSDENQEYFCDGMTEQIISSLSRIKKLKVISRTSVMKFKSSRKTIPEIAGILNVNFVLEGSVRRSDERIRVTAQLINTKDDFHVWSEDYDKQLGDIFDLQDDLSENIVTAMLSEISPEEMENVKSNRPTNLESYEFFLRGKYYHEKKFIGTDSNEEAVKLAEMMFKKSIALDSTFALPHTALADLYHSYYSIVARDQEEMQDFYRLMNNYLNKSFELDSALAYTYLVKGRIHTLNQNVKEAFDCYKRAVQLNPNNGWMNNGFCLFLFHRGLHQKAMKYADKSIFLDPLEPLFYVYRGLNYQWLGHVDKAETDYQKALRLEPQQYFALENYLHLLIENSRFREAGIYFDKLDQTSPNTNFIQAKFSAAQGDKEKALQFMGNNQNLQIIGLLGLEEKGAIFYQNAIDQDRTNNTSYYWLYKTNPCYDKLRDDPRFQNFLLEHRKIYEENLTKYGTI